MNGERDPGIDSDTSDPRGWSEQDWTRFVNQLSPMLVGISRNTLKPYGFSDARQQLVIEEATSRTWQTLWSAVQKSGVRESLERFACGVIRNCVRKEAERSIRQADRHEELTSRVAADFSSQAREVASDAQVLRRKIGRCVERIHGDCVSEAARGDGRYSFRNSPFHHLSILDLGCAGICSLEDLGSLFGGKDPGQLSKMRQSAEGRALKLLREVLPEGQQELFRSKPFSALWQDKSGGCLTPGELSLRLEPAHETDRTLHHSRHLRDVKCPVCLAAERALNDGDPALFRLRESLQQSVRDSLNG